VSLGVFQEILGHEDITTTEIYLHVATGANGLGVVSPLDRITNGAGIPPSFIPIPPLRWHEAVA